MLTPSPSGSGFRTLLHNRAFLILWGGQIISQLADKIFLVLLITLVVNYDPPRFLENSMNSAVMVANTLPAVFLGSAAGIFVDRYPKRIILSSSNVLRGLLVLSIPVFPKLFLILLLIAFLESILTQFFAPAEQSAIPLVVPEHNLLTANALFITTMMGSLVVGFAIGEPLLSWSAAWGGNYGREVLVGGLYILAGVILGLLPLKEELGPDRVELHPWQDLQEGFRYLRRNRLLSNAMVQLTVLYCVFAALTVLAVGLAGEIGLKPTQFGFLLAAAGIGLIGGAGFLGQWGNRLHHRPLPLIGFLLMATVLLLFSFVNSFWVSLLLRAVGQTPDPATLHQWQLGLGLLLSVILGVGSSLVGVPMQTLIQVETPPLMRGKVFGFQNNIVNIALSVPLAIAGILADKLGLRFVLVSMGLIVALAGVWAWQSTRRVLEDIL
uniref:Major facilitator superfamily MFS_1 n=1 Tax=Cyanothece sp. (strain PCC 7425 / ATCC 29141) TaxID=395961 RepID=B8HU14_CYAP4